MLEILFERVGRLQIVALLQTVSLQHHPQSAFVRRAEEMRSLDTW